MLLQTHLQAQKAIWNEYLHGVLISEIKLNESTVTPLTILETKLQSDLNNLSIFFLYFTFQIEIHSWSRISNSVESSATSLVDNSLAQKFKSDFDQMPLLLLSSVNIEWIWRAHRGNQTFHATICKSSRWSFLIRDFVFDYQESLAFRSAVIMLKYVRWAKKTDPFVILLGIKVVNFESAE